MVVKKDRRDDGSDLSEGDDNRRSGAERRLTERLLVDLEVDYRSDDTFLFAYITDISAMGIFVRTLEPEALGTLLNLRFQLPGDALPFEVEGIVSWVNLYRPGVISSVNPGMGVRFMYLTEGQREQLTHLVKTFAYLDDDDDAADGS